MAASGPKRWRADSFQWADSDLKTLLEVIVAYKATKESCGIDWESCKLKYAEIHARFNLKVKLGEASTVRFTKERVLSKVKFLRSRYKAAVDSGSRNGGGRVVATYFDLCSTIWSGSPAVKAVEGGLDPSETFAEEAEENEERDMGSPSGDEEESSGVQGQDRRPLLAAAASVRRHKLPRRRTPDAPDAAIALQRDMFSHMQEMDRAQTDVLKGLLECTTTLTKAVSDCLATLTRALHNQQPPTVFYQPSQPPAPCQCSQKPPPNQ